MCQDRAQLVSDPRIPAWHHLVFVPVAYRLETCVDAHELFPQDKLCILYPVFRDKNSSCSSSHRQSRSASLQVAR